MLVLLSDLHFTDGSAGRHNLSTDAARLVFRNIGEIAKRREAKEIKVVLLGDIFDLLRTELWFEHPAVERPWGEETTGEEGRAEALLRRAIKVNEEALDLIAGSCVTECEMPLRPEFVYVPGNHDRLLRKHPSLYSLACQALGITEPPEVVPHDFASEKYALFARHGHEFDPYNFEGDESLSPSSYVQMPIGDPITTELACRLPYEVIRDDVIRERLDSDELARLERNLKELDNVRPLSATLRWVRHRVRGGGWIEKRIETILDRVVAEFEAIPSVKRWMKDHDRTLRIFDEADRLQAGLTSARRLPATAADGALWLAEKAGQIAHMAGAPDRMVEGALGELERQRDEGISYIAYGHTHGPRVTPLTGSKAGDDTTFYINTGAFRAVNQERADGRGFGSWKQLTYTLFYDAEESSKAGQLAARPSFDTWTGQRHAP